MRRDCFYIDTETCGFHGLPVLIQYAFEDGDVHLFEPWTRPVEESLRLVERFCESTCVFFNASFDWFQLIKLYTTWSLLPSQAIPAELPVLQVAEAERDAIDGPCLKPRDCLCLMLHSRKGSLQTLMSRSDIRVSRVPKIFAQQLANILENKIELDGILFAKRKDQNAPKWKVFDRHLRGKIDQIDTDFQDVVLKFKASRALKAITQHCLNLDPEFHSFKDVYPVRSKTLREVGYIPYALGISASESNWSVYDLNGKTRGYSWPAVIHGDIEHWHSNEEARRYARDDVIYTRMLDEYFEYPDSGDNDSVLACMVAAVRWHGYELDHEKIKVLLESAQKRLALAPCNLNKPHEVRQYVREVMDESETPLLDKSTKKANLEKLRESYVVKREDLDPELCDLPCNVCSGTGHLNDDEKSECSRCLGTGKEPGGEQCIRCYGEGCPRCEGRGYLLMGKMPIAERADFILKCKIAAKEVELYTKLLRTRRFHAAFNVIGTLSSRMSGAAGLNAQGIKNDKEVRSAFPLKWEGMKLCGGDFDSFEVTLADAVFKDEQLRKDLLEGRSIHTTMALELYEGKTEEQILLSKSHKDGGDIDMYSRGKQAVFAFLYGGDENTINKKLSIPIGTARKAMTNLQEKYPGIKEARERVASMFSALKQPGGIGTNVIYVEPQERIVTFLGFPRYFTIENKIIKELFDLAHNIPAAWHQKMVKVRRSSDKEQTAAGAVSSALYGCAFSLQSSNIRAANNHLIQSPGAMITKDLQVAIWKYQPSGVNQFVVAPMNVHDEVLVVAKPEVVDDIARTVVTLVESYRDRVPLIGMEWCRDMMSWGEKGKVDVPIKPQGMGSLRDDTYVPPMTTDELDWLEEQEVFFEFDKDITEWL